MHLRTSQKKKYLILQIVPDVVNVAQFNNSKLN